MAEKKGDKEQVSKEDSPHELSIFNLPKMYFRSMYGVAGASHQFLSKVHTTSMQTGCPWYLKRLMLITVFQQKQGSENLPAREREFLFSPLLKHTKRQSGFS